jgi:hypothetical protein
VHVFNLRDEGDSIIYHFGRKFSTYKTEDGPVEGWFPLIATFSISCRGGAHYLAIAQNSYELNEKLFTSS